MNLLQGLFFLLVNPYFLLQLDSKEILRGIVGAAKPLPWAMKAKAGTPESP